MSFNCTSPHETIAPKLFIEASAGTGKTFVIEHYVVRAVLDASLEGNYVDPKAFALITFTKAVARELRLRVQTALRRARDFFLEENISDDIPEYFSLYTDKKQAVRALSLFLDQLRAATITTIHGFCEKILDNDPSASEMGGWEQSPKKWLQEFLEEENSITIGEWNALARHDLYDHDYFLTRVLELMDDAAIEKTRSRKECVEALLLSMEGLRAAFPELVPDTARILSGYARQFRGNCSRDGSLHAEKKAFFEAVQSLLKCFSEKELQKLLRLRCNLLMLFGSPLKGYVPLQGDEYNYFQALIGEVWPHIQALLDPEAIRRRLARDAAKAFFEYAEKNQKKTFEILLRRVLSLTEQKSFCERIRKEFSWVIVDEFQDTDTTQLALFTKLFLQDEWKGKILFVGDPKQAIYAFRKADVYSYMRAKDLLQEHVRTLYVNYRASAPLVEALNALFSGPEHPFIFYLPKEERHLAITPSLSAGRVQPLLSEERGALHFVQVRDALGRKRNWPHEDAEKKLLCWMHDELITLEQAGVPLKQQAILVKDRYQAKRVEEFLSGKNIPTCSWRLDLVTESQMYFWLKRAFSLLTQPNNKKKLLTLLFSMNGEKEHCSDMAREQNLTKLAMAFVEWEKVRRAFMYGGIGALSRELFDCRYNGNDPLHVYLARQERGKELTADLEQILEALSQLEERVPRDISAFLDVLEHLEEYFTDSRETLLRRVDPEDSGVPILTMHRSKGLEFDVVYSLGSSSRTPSCEGNLEEIDAEKLRQAYVALTRAKKRVYLPLFFEEEGKKVQRGQASPTELLLACLHVGRKSTLDLWADSLYQSMTPFHQEEVMSTLQKEHPGVITSSCVTPGQPILARDKVEEIVQEACAGKLSGRWAETTSFSQEKRRQGLVVYPAKSHGGALLGITFHEAIASLLFDEKASSQESIMSSYPQEHLASFLFHALRVSLPLRGGVLPLTDISRSSMRVEASFLFKEGARYVSGVIDLLFQHEGYVYALDWKTQEVDMPLKEYILEEQYDLQSSLYRKAVEKAFPKSAWGGFFFVFVNNLASGKEAVIQFE